MRATFVGFEIHYMTLLFMKNDEIDKIISARVNLHIEKLRALRPDELRKLSLYTEERFEVGGKPQVLGVYRNLIQNG